MTCATVTLELGIDIGRLERIIQLDSPDYRIQFASAPRQIGKDGEPRPEMMMVFREENPLPNTPLPQLSHGDCSELLPSFSFILSNVS